MIVTCPTSLLWLAASGALYLLKELYGTVGIPEAVYEEAVRRGPPWAKERIGRAEKEGWLRVWQCPLQSIPRVKHVENALGIGLGKAERCSVALALDVETALLLTDDQLVSVVARVLNLRVRGSAYVILRALKTGLIGPEEVVTFIERALDAGLPLPQHVVAGICVSALRAGTRGP